jgi:hypothetical protein
MNSRPPPVPLSATGQNPNRFPNVASLFCLLSPLILVGLAMACALVFPHLSPTLVLWGTLALGGVSCLLLLAGPIMGILALLMMKEGGRGRIAICSLLGLVLTGGLVALAVPGAMKARARTLAQLDAQLKATAEQKTAATATTNSATVSVKKFTQPQDDTPKSNPAENALVQKAGDAYMLRIQAVQGAYKDALAKLSAAHVLSTKDLATHENLQQRREIVENFLKCNANLKNFYSASEDNFRGELARLNVTQPTIEAQMAGFHKSTAPRLPVLLAMRKQDDEMGRGMLAVLDLLEATWGHWSYDQSTGHVRFENQAFVEQYNIDLRDINAAVQQGEVAKKQLTKATSQTPVQ